MLLDDKRLYVVGDDTVVALDLQGQILWRQNVRGFFNGHTLLGMAVPGGQSLQPAQLINARDLRGDGPAAALVEVARPGGGEGVADDELGLFSSRGEAPSRFL